MKNKTMEQKRFTKNDNSFICAHCGKEVEPLGYSSRNHCPFCLWSLHVDINPGDRANTCGGLLEPIRTEPDPKKGFIIIHRCVKCGETRRNRAATDAKVQPDNKSLLIKLTVAK
jgi:DNA-directed RNA polymerase subunit RPC12/RpoP